MSSFLSFKGSRKWMERSTEVTVSYSAWWGSGYGLFKTDRCADGAVGQKVQSSRSGDTSLRSHAPGEPGPGGAAARRYPGGGSPLEGARPAPAGGSAAAGTEAGTGAGPPRQHPALRSDSRTAPPVQHGRDPEGRGWGRGAAVPAGGRAAGVGSAPRNPPWGTAGRARSIPPSPARGEAAGEPPPPASSV